jgi:hypothetical protein
VLVTSRLIAVFLLAAAPIAASAQVRPKIALAIESRSEGRPDPDATAARLAADVRSGLSSIPDVEIVASDGSRRAVWIITGATAGSIAASVMVTERYDRETLMVLGIEDDEMAFRMMALQIVSDHQIFTGHSTAEVARRIVTALDTGVLARLRKLPPRP